MICSELSLQHGAFILALWMLCSVPEAFTLDLFNFAIVGLSSNPHTEVSSLACLSPSDCLLILTNSYSSYVMLPALPHLPLNPCSHL